MTVGGADREVLRVLTRSVPFEHVPASDLRVIGQHFQARNVTEGTVLCREGQPGDEMYVVEAGRFSVEGRVGGKRVRFAELGSGAIIGEIAVIAPQPRTATITALSSSRIWVLSRQDFHGIAAKYPEVAAAIARIANQRLSDTSRWRLANERQRLIGLSPDRDVITIGRSLDCDIVIADPTVSRLHATVRRVGETYEVIDQGSANGTFVNSDRIRSRTLGNGDTIWIGSNAIVFDASALTRYSRGGGIQVDAIGVTRRLSPDVTILKDVTLSIYPGEFVCIVGGSGAGKTTLLNALSGVRPGKSWANTLQRCIVL